jgi:hypothetical protein
MYGLLATDCADLHERPASENLDFFGPPERGNPVERTWVVRPSGTFYTKVLPARSRSRIPIHSRSKRFLTYAQLFARRPDISLVEIEQKRARPS